MIDEIDKQARIEMARRHESKRVLLLKLRVLAERFIRYDHETKTWHSVQAEPMSNWELEEKMDP